MRWRNTLRESDVTHAIRDLLRLCKIPHSKNLGTLGQEKGRPDIEGCLPPDGKFFCIEVKAPGRKIRAGSPQARYLDRIRKAGGIAFEADSVDAVVKCFEEQGYRLPVLL